ncbi:DUF1735 domain-containing protein [Pedobacter rhizosphaerae]|uniref:BT-3987-like N-terminal domain-containing protein n=1 Tax=Pedobacter rhizosphaerae TaxID=390241 RepID=A0A1H9RAR9_9SPHI|nr:DUF1735 domain-containing protein [Pedobacter rhizosphaerae]SER69023.1 protein of unknown function [Pedobacter rhizosphaerae]
MKKENILKGVALMLSVTVLTACLKNKNEQPDFSSTVPVVEIPVGSPMGDGSVNSLSTSLIQKEAPNEYVFYINYAASTIKTNDIKVTLGVNPAVIANYNAAHSGAPLTIVPSAAFSMPSSIVIPAGQRRVQVPVKFVSGALDPDISYGLPVTITDASGEVISKNFASVVIKVAVRNKYDGVYSFKGYVFREGDPVLTGNFSGLSKNLITNGAKVVDFSQVWSNGGDVAGIDGLRINVDPATNKVTMTSSANATLQNDPAYDNRYDPVTKTFYLSFKWGTSPATRSATDTLTFTGNRP